MPFELIRNDITKVKADAIVNSANPEPAVGSGTDSAVYKAAGYDKMLKERQKIGQIKPGEAAVTKAFALPAKYVIHTVGPIWMGGENKEAETLASCYRKCMALAEVLGCSSIAFPLISTGVYGFPKDLALSTALKTIESFLEDSELNVILTVFDKDSYELSSSTKYGVRAFINDNLVSKQQAAEYSRSAYEREKARMGRSVYSNSTGIILSDAVPTFPTGSVDDILKTKGATFQEKLLSLIDEKGLTDVETYKRANIDRKLFSKIRSNADYVPKKTTALAFAAALELNYAETQDLLARAGMTLSHSSRFDLIVEYCIRNRIYDVYQINSILFDNGQHQLGSSE